MDQFRLCGLFMLVTLATRLTAQVPSIVSVAPISGPIGTTIAITGTNFRPNPTENVVFFGSTRAVVSSATATELEVVVPTGASFEPITVQVNGLTAYSASPFVATFDNTHTIGETTFLTKTDFVTGASPFELCAGDFDGDGKVDLVATASQGNSISVLRNAGVAGEVSISTFGARADLSAGSAPHGLARGDLDGDGMPDLACTVNGTSLVIFRNTSLSGAISFAAGYEILIGYNIAVSDLVIWDLDGDGKPDLAAIDQISNRVLVFRNTSTAGTINAQSFDTHVDFTTGTTPIGIAAGDLNGDGKPEVVVTNNNASTISVFRNTSTPGTIDGNSFAAKVDLEVGHGPLALAIGDVDADEKPDIVTTNYFSNTISILKNQVSAGVINSSSFGLRSDLETGVGPQSVAMGDLDGDSKVDLAVANFSANVSGLLANTISVFRNTGGADGIVDYFYETVFFKVGINPVSVAIGDFDGDGKVDLAATGSSDNTISVLRHRDSQTISGFDPIPAKNIGDPAFEVSATASSGLPVQFTTSSDEVTIVGNQVSIVKAGKTTIVAEQPGDDIYSAALKVSRTFCINPSKPNITLDITDAAKPKLTSSSEVGNQWYHNETLIAGATSQDFIVKEKGIYSVKVVIEDCASPVSESQSFIITGDTEAIDAIQPVIAPNPVHDFLLIRLYGFKPQADVALSLIDRTGRLISNVIAAGGDALSIDVRDFSEGLYILTMTQGKVKKHAKFIKK